MFNDVQVNFRYVADVENTSTESGVSNLDAVFRRPKQFNVQCQEEFDRPMKKGTKLCASVTVNKWIKYSAVVNCKQWNATYFISSKAPLTASRRLFLDCWINAEISADDSSVGMDIWTIVLPNAYRRLLTVDRFLQVWQQLLSLSNNVAASRFLQRTHSGSDRHKRHSSFPSSVGMRQSEISTDRLWCWRSLT